ncbi:hypothetical protein DPMN_069268 [Dreissena polymorpha]|uniref:C2H2-type domain-containing protein n=1 Tax=Dreissena polymorpha TaxID=45954 RepID=A0A9D4BWZ6_DREPO|nr:hypothetical protein DPMN_069268 [Dreissena polymorpha]
MRAGWLAGGLAGWRAGGISLCAICGMICSDNWKFQRHMTTHSGERPYECEVCHKTYKTEMSLKSHMKRKHVGLLDAPLLETVGGSVEQPLSEDSLFETVSGGVGQATEAFGEASVASLEQSVYLQKLKYSCSVCGLYCFHSAALQEHVRTHTGEKPFTPKQMDVFSNTGTFRRIPKASTCVTCGKHCTSQSALTIHMRVHTGERPFKCHLCGKGFINKSNMKAHMTTHMKFDFVQTHPFASQGQTKPPLRNFVCKICNKELTSAYGYTVHMRVHTGEKPYVCKMCGKRFTQKSHIKSHMIVHIREDGSIRK